MKLLDARVHAIEWLSDGVIGIELRPCDIADWPIVTAGAHIDLFLPNGLTRSYSLTNRPGESHRYTVAVAMDAASRGGSIFVHNDLRVGQKIRISAPRNHFPVDESASHSVFIAGGIGITPIWCMVQRLSQIGSTWEVHYSARARTNAAFVDQVVSLAEQTGNAVHLTFDGGVRGLNDEFVKALRSPDVRQRLASRGFEPGGSTPGAFAELIQADEKKWPVVVKQAGLHRE